MSSLPAPADLIRALGPFARRWRLQRLVAALGPAWLVALPLGAWAHSGGPQWAWALAGAAGLGVPLVALVWPLASARVAREADRVGGLSGTCDTALHLARVGHPAAEAVGLDARDALAGATPAPLLWRRTAGLVLAAGLVAAPAPLLEARRQAARTAETTALIEDLAVLEDEALASDDPDLAEDAAALQDLIVQILARDVPDEPQPNAEPEEVEEPEQGGAAASDPDIAGVQAALDVARHQLGPDEIARLTEQLHQLVDVRDRLHEVAETTTTGTVGWRDQATAQPLQDPTSNTLSDPSLPLDDLQRDLDIPGMDLANTENEALPEELGEDSIGNLEHELGLVFQQTIDDFVEDYAQSMLEELQALLATEAEEAPRTQLAEDAETKVTFEAPEEGTPDDPGLQATATAAQGGEALARAGATGIGNTDPGGSGAGKGTGGEGQQVEIDEARGQLAPLEADQDLDQLGPSARRDLIAAVSRHATAEDVGLGIDALAEPYFLEVDQALDADGVPPAMRAVIASYFESLQGSPPQTEAAP